MLLLEATTLLFFEFLILQDHEEGGNGNYDPALLYNQVELFRIHSDLLCCPNFVLPNTFRPLVLPTQAQT